MVKDLWEADIFDGVIYVRLIFWHQGLKGGCARAVSVKSWRQMKDPKGLLEIFIKEMEFGKAQLIADL